MGDVLWTDYGFGVRKAPRMRGRAARGLTRVEATALPAYSICPYGGGPKRVVGLYARSLLN